MKDFFWCADCKYLGELCPMGILHGVAWPLLNVWLGVTVENQEMADLRIPILLSIPAAVHWVSIEPMLSNMNIEPYLSKILCEGCYREMDYLNQYHEVFYNSSDPPELCGQARKTIGLDWIALGGETGPGARLMNPEWARSIKDQCNEAGVPFFFKQMGSAWKGATPPDLMVREMPCQG